MNTYKLMVISFENSLKNVRDVCMTISLFGETLQFLKNILVMFSNICILIFSAASTVRLVCLFQ